MTSSPESRAGGGRLPDFFIVGHPKCGTTALYEMLRRHPQIYMPDLKEPRYFAPDLRSRFQPRPAMAGRGPAFPETLEQYLALFADARPDQLLGEASPSYLRSAVAARSIAQARPDARIVAILREPASFLRSLHLELVQNHVETETDLRRAIAAERLGPAERGSGEERLGPAERSSGEERLRPAERGSGEERLGPAEPTAGDGAVALRYSDRVRYVEQLRRYRAVFAPEQVLVLIYDDFRDDNQATVRRVLRFLGVDDTVAIAAVRANPSVRIRSVRLDRLVRALQAGGGPLSRGAGRGLRALIPRRWRGARLAEVRRRLLHGAPLPPDAALMRELRLRFRAEVVALSEYLERDLVGEWGYDLLD